MSIRQREDETLRFYIALSIDKADDKILVTAFMNGLRKGKFLFSLYKNDPKTMLDVLYRATKYMNAEDALLAHKEKPKKRERQEEGQQDRGQKMTRTGEKRDERWSKSLTGWFTNFTPLNTPIDQVLIQIKDEGALTFPSKLKGDPSKRSKDKYCRFHRDHDHDTFECYNLKQQIEALIRQGKLQKFIGKKGTEQNQRALAWRENEWPWPPLGDIRFIIEGSTSNSSKKARKTYLRMVQNIQLTGYAPKKAWVDNPIIGFTEEDVWCLHHPHDDALVVSIRVKDYHTYRVLVDNGSFVDILYYLAFQQMRIEREQLIPTNSPLVGFGGIRVYPMGAVTLPVTVEDYP